MRPTTEAIAKATATAGSIATSTSDRTASRQVSVPTANGTQTLRVREIRGARRNTGHPPRRTGAPQQWGCAVNRAMAHDGTRCR